MAFTIPNRPDTGIEADQAEPDKGDFQTLGYQKSGVLSGGATTKTSDNSVRIAAITGYLNGEYFEVAITDRGAFTAPTAGLSKFVLIIVQATGDPATYSVSEIEGTTSNNGMSATNARYPDIDPTTQMLVAAVHYANGDTVISPNAIVDKRVVILPQANPTLATTTPPDAEGALGEIRLDSSIGAGSTGQSNVWIKTATTGTSRWTNIASYTPETPQNGFVPVSPVHHYRTDTGVVVGGSGTASNTGNTHGGVAYTLLVDGSANVTGNLKVDSLTIGDDTLAVSSNWTEGRTIELTGDVEGTVAGVDGSDDITISTSVNNMVPLVGHAEFEGPMYTQHLFPVGGSPANWQIGSIYMTYKKIVLTDSPVVMSDRALKERFSEPPGLTFVEDLIPRSYVLKDDPKKVHWGFVAQDVEETCTEHGVSQAAVYEKPGDGPEGQTGYMALTYGEFTAPIVKAIQELSERLEAIENG